MSVPFSTKTYEVEKFIQEYPDISEENFIDQITNLQEFNELTLDPDTGSKPKPADVDGGKNLLKDQVFFKRFLSQHTPYKEMLVFKGVGTGKTMTMAALKEANVFNVADGSKMNPALVLVKGPGMKKNIEKELSIHFSDKYGAGDRKRLDSVMNRVAKNYEIVTWETFLKKTPNPKNYRDRIVIVDESHHFLDDNDEISESAESDKADKADSSLYNKLFSFLHSLEGCTKILMSGTPMRNSAADFADQMNLILPLDKQFPKGEEFMKKYFDSNKKFKADMFQDFSKKIAGRVTYLRTPWVKKDVYGEFVPGFTKYLKLTLSEMSKEQTSVVRDIVDNNKKAFGNAESRASVVSDAVNARNYAIHSAKFKKLVEIIKDPKRQGENLFIYSDHVNDSKSGRAAIFQLKQLFLSLGFVQISNHSVVLGGNKIGFIDANDKNTTEGDLEKIITKFNSPENKNGAFARIILGGPKLSEGYSFKNIRQIHILNPPWHMASLTQSVARGIRFGSLADFTNEADRHVTVFYHASYYHGSPEEECPDYRVYRLIEEKEYEIAQMIRAIKVNAVDCGLNISRNTNVNDEDYSQECNYEKCEYTCNTTGFDGTSEAGQHLKNFNFMYSNTTSKKIMNELAFKFNRVFRLTFDELKSYFEAHPDFKFLKGGSIDFILLKTFDEIISNRITFTNKYGFKCYVKEYKNVFFLSNDYSNDKQASQFYQTSYLENPIIRKRENQDKIIRSIEVQDDLEYIGASCTDKYEFLKLSFQSRILIIEDMFKRYFSTKSESKIPDFILKYFKYIYIPLKFTKDYPLLSTSQQKISHNNDIYHTLFYSEKLEYKTDNYKETKIKPTNKTRILYSASGDSGDIEWVNTNDKNTFDFMKQKRKAVNAKNVKKLNIEDEIKEQFAKERAEDEKKKEEYYTLVEIRW